MLLIKEYHWLSKCLSILAMTETNVTSSMHGSVGKGLVLTRDRMFNT